MATDENTWSGVVGPGRTRYTVQYKGGQDDIRFNFENDNSTVDLPIYVLWGSAAQDLDQAKRDILGYPIVLLGGTVPAPYLSRVTPMTVLPFKQLTNALPYLYATSLSGTGYGVPANKVVKNDTLTFPIYHMTKCSVHFDSVPYDIFTDQQMVLFGFTDANLAPDEATLARYVTKQVSPGMEYLTLPQGGFQFVNTGNKPVPGTAGKLTPNYDLELTWEQVPLSCVGTVLFNPGLTNPPIDNCLGCVNNAGFPPIAGTGQQKLISATIASGGTGGYVVGDWVVVQGGLAISAATLVVTTVGGGGVVTGVSIISGGQYAVAAGIPSPPTNPLQTLTSGDGFGLTLNGTFGAFSEQQLMTAYPAAAGTGYTLGDTLSLVGGTPTTTATVRVVALTTAAATGPVLAVDIINRGSYVVNAGTPSPPANPVSTAGGTGTGCTLTCEFGNGIPPGQLLMTAATITPINSAAGDRVYKLGYRFKYLPQGVQRLYYQGSPAAAGGAYTDAGYFEVTTNGVTNIGLGKYNSNIQRPPVNIYPWANFASLFRVPS